MEFQAEGRTWKSSGSRESGAPWSAECTHCCGAKAESFAREMPTGDLYPFRSYSDALLHSVWQILFHKMALFLLFILSMAQGFFSTHFSKEPLILFWNGHKRRCLIGNSIILNNNDDISILERSLWGSLDRLSLYILKLRSCQPSVYLLSQKMSWVLKRLYFFQE